MDFSTTSANYAPDRDVLDLRSSTYCEYACVAQQDQDYTLGNFAKHYGVVMDSNTFTHKLEH